MSKAIGQSLFKNAKREGKKQTAIIAEYRQVVLCGKTVEPKLRSAEMSCSEKPESKARAFEPKNGPSKKPLGPVKKPGPRAKNTSRVLKSPARGP
jgi:hypothetical protein